MAEIKKKIWSEFFDAIQRGEKKFELRLADFDLKAGDILVLEEFDPKTNKYTGRKITKKCMKVFKLDISKFYTPKQLETNGLYVIELD
ncbi:MAG: DUF3850 domain-containing protein [Nanoarchaeota archaeon]|nr:DUF3850 domain-containing protein [Nanoarchaeota archaeon]MBU4299623.1 DUF3850 domain-containing protein [Nanoarchaeota archaeon]MBU4452613.1 DUF3850 domain-containing protein [Nanoarchaeota archaeon]MCG2723920.1 DUF3850 domain-containing protein [archaeon]